jgi:hypothetical protein
MRVLVAAAAAAFTVFSEPPWLNTLIGFRAFHERAALDFSFVEPRSISFEKRLSLPSLVSSW